MARFVHPGTDNTERIRATPKASTWHMAQSMGMPPYVRRPTRSATRAFHGSDVLRNGKNGGAGGGEEAEPGGNAASGKECAPGPDAIPLLLCMHPMVPGRASVSSSPAASAFMWHLGTPLASQTAAVQRMLPAHALQHASAVGALTWPTSVHALGRCAHCRSTSRMKVHSERSAGSVAATMVLSAPLTAISAMARTSSGSRITGRQAVETQGRASTVAEHGDCLTKLAEKRVFVILACMGWLVVSSRRCNSINVECEVWSAKLQ